MRRATFVRPILFAALVAGSVGVTAFALQAAGFGRATRAELTATNSLRSLLRYRLVESNAVIDGRHLHGLCLSGWFRAGRRGRAGRGAGLVLNDGERAVLVRDRVFALRVKPRPEFRAYALLLVAGCSRVLADALYNPLEHRAPMSLAAVRWGGRAVYALGFDAGAIRVRLLVDRRTSLPLAIRVRSAATVGRAVLRVARLMPREHERLLDELPLTERHRRERV